MRISQAGNAIGLREVRQTGSSHIGAQKLGDTHPVLALPHDRPRLAAQSHGGDTIGLAIDGALAAQLREIAGKHRTSVFMLLLAAYQAALYRYTGQSDLRVGVPVAGRRHAQLERLIGCFVNTLVLRAEIVDGATFPDLLQQVKEAVIDALSHQDLPFEMLVDGLRPERSGGHNPLFQAKFNYMKAPSGFDGVEGLAAEIDILDLAGSHFDLALDIVDGAEGMKVTFNYATDLFDSATISRLATQFGSLLRQIAEDAERLVSDFVIDGCEPAGGAEPDCCVPIYRCGQPLSCIDGRSANRGCDPDAAARH